MRWFRAWGRSLAATVLVSLSLVSAGAAALHGSACHDAECAIRVVEHDASAHAFENAQSSSDEPPLHCVLCHWTRSFRPSTGSNHHGFVVESRDVRFHVTDVAVPHVCPAAQPPLRSPPASPAFA